MYADDGCLLLASSRSQLQAQLQVCERFADWAGIKFNNKKCRVMSRVLDGGRLVRDPQPFHLSDDLVEVIELGEV